MPDTPLTNPETPETTAGAPLPTPAGPIANPGDLIRTTPAPVTAPVSAPGLGSQNNDFLSKFFDAFDTSVKDNQTYSIDPNTKQLVKNPSQPGDWAKHVVSSALQALGPNQNPNSRLGKIAGPIQDAAQAGAMAQEKIADTKFNPGINGRAFGAAAAQTAMTDQQRQKALDAKNQIESVIRIHNMEMGNQRLQQEIDAGNVAAAKVVSDRNQQAATDFNVAQTLGYVPVKGPDGAEIPSFKDGVTAHAYIQAHPEDLHNNYNWVMVPDPATGGIRLMQKPIGDDGIKDRSGKLSDGTAYDLKSATSADEKSYVETHEKFIADADKHKTEQLTQEELQGKLDDASVARKDKKDVADAYSAYDAWKKDPTNNSLTGGQRNVLMKDAENTQRIASAGYNKAVEAQDTEAEAEFRSEIVRSGGIINSLLPGGAQTVRKQAAETKALSDSGVDTGYLSTLPAPEQAGVKAVITGHIVPTNWGYLIARNKQFLDEVARASNGTFDSSKAESYPQTYKDFTSGKTSQQLVAAANAFQHLRQLSDLNTEWSRVPGTGSKGAYNQLLDTVAGELAKAYGLNAVSDRESMKANMGGLGNRSDAIRQAALALGVQMDDLQEKWSNAAPSKAYDTPMPNISDAAKRARGFFDADYAKTLQPASGAAGATPKLGDVKTFPNGAKGVWDGTGYVKQ
jgi:hypothetical protein